MLTNETKAKEVIANKEIQELSEEIKILFEEGREIKNVYDRVKMESEYKTKALMGDLKNTEDNL